MTTKDGIFMLRLVPQQKSMAEPKQEETTLPPDEDENQQLKVDTFFIDLANAGMGSLFNAEWVDPYIDSLSTCFGTNQVLLENLLKGRKLVDKTFQVLKYFLD